MEKILPWMIFKKEDRYCLIVEVDLWLHWYVKLSNWVVLDTDKLQQEWDFVVWEYNVRRFNDVIYS